MTELDAILKDMDDVLFGGDVLAPNADSVREHLNDREDKIVYQEDIPNHLAKELLQPKDYDELCRYQIVSLVDATLLLKIDDRIKPEEDGEGFNKHITEYELSSEDEVVSYEQMLKSTLIPDSITATDDYKEIYRPKQRNNLVLMLVIIFTLLLLGIGLIVLSLKLFT